MTLNFLGHFARMVLVGYAAWLLLHSAALASGPGFRLLLAPVPTSASVSRGLAALAGGALTLGGLHIAMDVLYASREHVYRTLLAFTGIAVFYAAAIGLSLAVFLRRCGFPPPPLLPSCQGPPCSRKTLFPVLALVFATMLFSVSAHAIFVFFQTAFSSSLNRQV